MSRYHVRVAKPFDRYRKDEIAVLSENGFNAMEQKKPGFVDLLAKENANGELVTKDGKPVLDDNKKPVRGEDPNASTFLLKPADVKAAAPK